MAHLHKRFKDSEVKDLFDRFLKKEIERKDIQQILGIKKTQFFAWLNKFRSNPNDFSIQYRRESPTRSLPQEVENNIIKELTFEKTLIEDKDVRLYSYNYSFIKDILKTKYSQAVSLPTIIKRAKKNNFYMKKQKRKAHDRVVLTNYAGELIQHDASLHQWTPYTKEKWYMITSIDDYSRFILFAHLVKKETSVEHIKAMESIFLKYGMPKAFYVDSHSIFRFVQGRDSIWREHKKLTDQVPTQWQQVLADCNVEVIHALSPEAKGKVERPYQWLQDRLVRTCARENVSDIYQARPILSHELGRYNYHQVHSTTQEVPGYRFQTALDENKSLFRKFEIRPPFLSIKDIFCLRYERTTNAYGIVSFYNLQFRLPTGEGQRIGLRIYQLDNNFSEIRFWHRGVLLDYKKVKNSDLNLSGFNV
jgi:hypothetical protein